MDISKARCPGCGQAMAISHTHCGDCDATLEGAFDIDLKVLDYTEHALGTGRDARAAAYLHCKSGNREIWGCGIDQDVATASVRAVLSAANSAVSKG